MSNAFVKLYNFSSLSTCPMLSSNSTTSLPSQHVQCYMLTGKRSCRVWRKHWTYWEGREVVELDENIEHVGREEKLCSMLSSNSTTSLPSQHVQCFRQTLQLLFPLNMFNVFVKLYNFTSLSTCSMFSSNYTTKRSCRVGRKHWTCWEGREVVELDESIEHVGREEKL
jgi:hypothetical protein